MDGWSNCPGCRFYRETLLELPCCHELYCLRCLQDKARCPNCTRYFDIAECYENRPMVSLLEEVLVECRFAGCGHKTTKILLNQHEASCKHVTVDPSLLDALMDPLETPNAIALSRKKNIFTPFMMYNNVKHILDCMENNQPLDSTPIPEDANSDDEFFTHIILESDTLQGLAIKYKVSISDLKETNRLTTDHLYERTALRIPRRTQPVFT